MQGKPYNKIYPNEYTDSSFVPIYPTPYNIFDDPKVEDLSFGKIPFSVSEPTIDYEKLADMVAERILEKIIERLDI